MRYIRSIIVIIVILFLLSSLIRNVSDYVSKMSFYQGYKQEYEKEKKTNTILQTEIRKKNSQDEIEKTIRNDLNLLKPNEIAILIPTPTPSPNIITPTPLPNWQQWMRLFIK
ncbi:MAG: septum formation initiator family protein [bacterium]|nr:septum formation initiator family protein [bacterium]